MGGSTNCQLIGILYNSTVSIISESCGLAAPPHTAHNKNLFTVAELRCGFIAFRGWNLGDDSDVLFLFLNLKVECFVCKYIKLSNKEWVVFNSFRFSNGTNSLYCIKLHLNVIMQRREETAYFQVYGFKG